MIKPRKKQLESFDHDIEAPFRKRIIEQLKEESTDSLEDLDDNEIDHMVKVGIERARANGFEWEQSIASFVGMMFDAAPNFDEHPACRKVLENADLEEMERMDALVKHVTEEEWEEISDRYDEAAWRFHV